MPFPQSLRQKSLTYILFFFCREKGRGVRARYKVDCESNRARVTILAVEPAVLLIFLVCWEKTVGLGLQIKACPFRNRYGRTKLANAGFTTTGDLPAHVYTYAHTRIITYTYKYTQTHKYICIDTIICIQTHTHTHTHTHIHKPTRNHYSRPKSGNASTTTDVAHAHMHTYEHTRT